MRLPFVSVAFALTACSESSAPHKPFVVEPTSLELRVGAVGALHTSAPTPPVWRSSTPLVASVSSVGLVTGVSRGEARVWAIIGADSASALVSVSDAICAVAPSVAPNNATIVVGDTAHVEARAGCGTSNAFTWRSADETIAGVVLRSNEPARSIATITARREGQVVIEASLADDPTVSVSFALVVRKP
jgi:uncharacterized protein YjdB